MLFRSTEDLFAKQLLDMSQDVVDELALAVSDEQIEQIDTLYQSPFANGGAVIEDGEEPARYRIDVQGTTVRFDEDMYSVVVTIEGSLPAKATDAILSGLQDRLSQLEGVSYCVRQIDV